MWWLVSQALADEVCTARPGVLAQTACTEADPSACSYAPSRSAGTFTRYPSSGSITLLDADALAQPNRPVPIIVNIPNDAVGPLPSPRPPVRRRAGEVCPQPGRGSALATRPPPWPGSKGGTTLAALAPGDRAGKLG